MVKCQGLGQTTHVVGSEGRGGGVRLEKKDMWQV